MGKKRTNPKSGKTDVKVARIATIAAGAAIGSAAIAAAVLFASRHRDATAAGRASSESGMPPLDRSQPETD